MRTVFVFPPLFLLFGSFLSAAFAQDIERQNPAPAPPGVEDPALPDDFDGSPQSGESGTVPSSEKREAAPDTKSAERAAAADPTLSPAERLDGLFADLKKHSSPDDAAKTASRIEEEWSDSGSETIDLLMLWAGQAMAKDDKSGALDLLSEAIVLKPDYAEAWNRRATLHYVSSDFGKSIYDIEQTLRLEPRHFGALMGLAGILEETERKPEALDTFMRVLEIYPGMKAAQDAVSRLSEELSGRAI